METVIELTRVKKSYRSGGGFVHAVREATVGLRRGELSLFMGPSGSGKTTLLFLMGCLLRPTEGTIRVLDQDVHDLEERDLPSIRSRYFGFVFQDFNLFPQLSAEENVALALDIAKNPPGAKRPSDLLGRFGLGDKTTRMARDLSGGEKQRVSIARALVTSPPIVLADEPTAALDSATGLQIMDTLKEVAREGRAVAVVSHDLRLTRFADRLFSMRDGCLEESPLPDPPAA